MIADFIISTVVGEFVFGLFWVTGYLLLRGVSFGKLRVRPYALFVMEGWSTDERGVYAWVAVLVGLLFWLGIMAALIFWIVA